MQRGDIISGIKQAIERGSSLEKAKQTFLNAGYSSQDVEDSSRVFLGVSGSIPQQTPTQKQVTQISQSFQQSSQRIMQPIILPSQPPQVNITVSPKQGKAMIVFIILLAIILMLLLAFLIATIFYKVQVQEFLEPIFPSLFSEEFFLGLI